MAVLNEEQSMLRDAAKSWVQEKSPVTAFRKMRDSGVELGYDAAAWNEQAEMGWAGVIIPEDFGGSNFGYLSMGLILEEMGRTLTASPLLASGLAAASALILGGNDAQKGEYLPKIADGSLVATLAVDDGAHHAPEKVALEAKTSGAGYVLNGKKTFVLEGPGAGLFVVSARTSGAAGDIQMATSLARSMVMEWGMSEKLGRVRYRPNEQEVFLGHSVSQSTNMADETAKLIDEEVRRYIEEGETNARRIISENHDKFVAIAEALLEFETLTGDELRGIMAGHPPVRDAFDDTTPPRGSAVPSTKPRPKGEEPDGAAPQPTA